jgi:hypothetical protein
LARQEFGIPTNDCPWRIIDPRTPPSPESKGIGVGGVRFSHSRTVFETVVVKRRRSGERLLRDRTALVAPVDERMWIDTGHSPITGYSS